MKRAGALVLSLLLCLALGMSVVAAPSPNATVTPSRFLLNGREVSMDNLNITQAGESEEIRAWIDRLSADGALAEQVSPSLAGMTLAALFDVNYTGEETGSMTITFQVPGVRAGETLYCIHYHDGAWEVITPDSIADNQVTVTFTSLSPVGFVVAQDSAAGTGAGTSPKTGAADMTTAVICLALAAGAGAAYSFRKLRRA